MAKSLFCFVWIYCSKKRYKNTKMHSVKWRNIHLQCLCWTIRICLLCCYLTLWTSFARSATCGQIKHLVTLGPHVRSIWLTSLEKWGRFGWHRLRSNIWKFSQFDFEIDLNVFISKGCKLSTIFSLVLFLLMDKIVVKRLSTETTVTWFTKFYSIHITNKN